MARNRHKRITYKTIARMLGLGIVIFIFVLTYQILLPASFKGTQDFVIDKGQVVGQIGDSLKEAGLIRSKLAFRVVVKLQGSDKTFQAGSYTLPSLALRDLVAILSSGEGAREQTITIIEGLRNRDIVDYLRAQEVKVADDFADLVGAPEKLEDLPAYLVGLDSLEGYLFPDTYRVFKDVEAKDLVRLMLDNFDNKISRIELADQIERSERPLHEIIIMASIIEKEVADSDERKVASGLLWKRLDVGMPLQVDSSVNYVTGKKTPALSSADRNLDTFYNTYLYPGLPPGPIANPGLDAIKAALYPQESEFWFYLSKPNGETVFSKNLEEHNKAKAKYLK